MLEKRRFPRFTMKLPVRLRIFDKETKTDITNDIDAYTENISKAGMRLILPNGWECPECNNCLGWMYNLNCKLKNNFTREANHFLTPKLNLRITISDASIPLKEPIQLEGDCVWVNANIHPQENSYPVGLSISEAEQERISPGFFRILSP
ncbi:MAG: PilZ domain-containing protein [Candidatus Omnitrophota bacterium]